MRSAFFVCWVLFSFGLIAGIDHANAFGEDSSSGNPNGSSATLSTSELENQLRRLDEYREQWGQRGMGDQSPGAAGGSPLANFGELMTIIETVVAGNWESQGGTSSMIPHPNGVKISTSGVIERINSSDETKRKLLLSTRPKADLSALGEWQTSASLRWISLNAIDDLISDRMKRKARSSVAMELLGGLYRIDYLAYDIETDAWLLGGPAGNLINRQDGQLVNSETGLPPVLLEDLLSIAPLILNGKTSFGCTIDPNPDRLIKSYEFAKKPSSLKALQRNPERWAEQWRKELGNQRTFVSGLPNDSPTGYAMLIADAEMKRLGMGLDPLPLSIRSYWQEADLLHQRSETPLVRWWFTLSSSSIPMDPDRRIYALNNGNVELRSESQDFEGHRRVASQQLDRAADSFAERFTRNFHDLYKNYPIFGRLRHIMDLAVVLEIVRAEQSGGRGAGFHSLRLEEVQPHLPTAPQEIESIAATHKTFDGSSAAVVSGGVSVSVDQLKKRIKRDPDKLSHVVVTSGFPTDNNRDVKANKEVFWR